MPVDDDSLLPSITNVSSNESAGVGSNGVGSTGFGFTGFGSTGLIIGAFVIFIGPYS